MKGIKGNKFIDNGEWYIGYAANGKTFKFDKENIDLINKYTWTVDSDGYVRTRSKGYHLFMHRLIMGMNIKEIDHKNLDKSDNRKENLRECTRSQNQMNRGLSSNNTSGAKGVSWRKDLNKWAASIRIEGKLITLGKYIILQDAINARMKAEQKYCGEFGRAI